MACDRRDYVPSCCRGARDEPKAVRCQTADGTMETVEVVLVIGYREWYVAAKPLVEKGGENLKMPACEYIMNINDGWKLDVPLTANH